KAETIPESQQLALKLNPKDLPSLGFREIIDVIPEKQPNGKTLWKYNLTDYKWMTIGEAEQRIGELSRGFLSHGVQYQEPVLIFAETRVGRCIGPRLETVTDLGLAAQSGSSVHRLCLESAHRSPPSLPLWVRRASCSASTRPRWSTSSPRSEERRVGKEGRPGSTRRHHR